MNNTFSFLIQFIFAITFCFIYILSISLIKPFRLNIKRPISTLLLKSSYLLYLAILIIFIYFLIFFQPEGDDDTVQLRETVLLIIVCLLPTLGIIVRREFQSIRVQYNYAFSFINIVATALLILYLFINKWSFN